MLFTLLVRLIEVSLFFSVGFLLESLIPANQNTRQNRLFNCCYTLFFETFDITGAALVASWVSAAVSKAPFHNLLALGSDKHSIVLALGLTFFGIAASDFFYYWFHRVQHRSKWLWAEHELHHSDECMNVTTTWRHHWLERPLTAIFMVGPTILLFKPPTITVLWVVILTKATAYFIHLNARISLGRLGVLAANPHFHRIHHSKLPQHLDRNFASMFPLWDVIFGTYYHPQRDEWPQTGLASGETVTSVSYALVMPFVKWARMARDH